MFTNVKLLNQPPILISKKKDRKKGIIIREFYTNQPLHIWEEKKKDIQAKFSSTFVSKGLEYGGKNHNDGKKIILYMRKGLQAEDRGTMYHNDGKKIILYMRKGLQAEDRGTMYE